MTAAGRLARERDFHDELAAELNPERMPPPTPGELDRTFLDQIGDVQGKDVLDLGCGTGDLTLDLAAAGAEVTGLDLSPGMVAVAERRLAEFLPDRSARFVAAVAEESGLPTASFDLVVGRYVIHHLDASEGAAEIHRLLRPGGRAVFLETWGGNPVLMFARRHLAGRFGIPRYGTEDEHPLTDDEVGTMARHFERASAEHPTFEFFRIFDRQVLRFRFTWASRLLTGIDRFMFRFPALRRFSFRVLLTFEK